MFYCENSKKLLELYNSKNNTKITIKEFFYDVFLPLFYDDEISLMSITNSPSFTIHKDKSLEAIKSRFISKISEGKNDASIYVGGPPETVFSAVKSQFEDVYFKIDEESIYHSWIGHALSIMVKGGYCLAINDEKLIWLIYEGWYEYKKMIMSDLKVAHNKINNWNATWILKNNSKEMFDGFDYDKYLFKNKKTNINEFNTQFWGKILFALSRISKSDLLLSYVYQLGQQNTTIGFIPIIIKDNRRLIDAYVGLFGKDNYVKNKNKIEELYGSFYDNFDKACENGSIGFKCLRPKYKQIKNDKDNIEFLTYKTWIMELLKGKIENLEILSEKVSDYLIDFKKRTTKTMKATNSEKGIFIKDFLETKNKNRLITKLAKLSSEDKESKEIVNQMKDIVVKLNNEDFGMMMDFIQINYNQKQWGQ